MRGKDEVARLRVRYLNRNRPIKRKILDGLCTLHGYHGKAAIRLLNVEVNRLSRVRDVSLLMFASDC